MPLKVVQFGLGSLGLEILRAVRESKDLELVGVVDTDPAKIGRDAGSLAIDRRIGIRVGGVDEALRRKPGIAIHATTSYLDELYSQISGVLAKGTSVISTCEQLVYPYTSEANTRIARRLDALAKKNDARILGVGINPGFVMDLLVISLAGLCGSIERIRVERFVDIARRRRSLQQKMCMGMTAEEFGNLRKGRRSGRRSGIGHIGLTESASMICDSLNVKASFTSTVRPLVAERLIRSYDLTVEPGMISGLEHRLIGKKRRGKRKFIEMILYMFAGASEFDLVEIDGEPPLSVRTDGIHGDQATISLLLNYIPVVLEAEAGLHTVKDLRLPGGYNAASLR